MHMGIPECKQAGIAKKFAYGDPITHNEIVRIRGVRLHSLQWGVHWSFSFSSENLNNLRVCRVFASEEFA